MFPVCLGRHLEWWHCGSLLFFDGTVTGESYLEMLREVVLPELENSPLYNTLRITVYEFENSLITAFWNGSDGMVQLSPPRSCDFSVGRNED
jgi:hypothetical protein